MDSLILELAKRSSWYAIWETKTLEDLLAKHLLRLRGSTLSETVPIKAIALIGTVRRQARDQLEMVHILRALNGNWVPPQFSNRDRSKNLIIPLDCFKLEMPLLAGTPPIAMTVVAAAHGDWDAYPNLFTVDETGFAALLRDPSSLIAIRAVSLQIYEKGEGICARVSRLSAKMKEAFHFIFGKDDVGAMIPFIPTSRDGTPIMLPIWENQLMASRQGRVSVDQDPATDRTMFINLSGLCDEKTIGVPYISVSPLKDAKELVKDMKPLAGMKVPTETLREAPIFSKKSPLINTGGCISFGHIGTMPSYLGFFDDPKSLSVFGHIHGSRFRTKKEFAEKESPFDVMADTITPCRVSEDTILNWATIFPTSSCTSEERAAGRNLICNALQTPAAFDSVPNLPMQMYGPKFNVTDAALVEAIHWWAAFTQVTIGEEVSTGRIVGAMDESGTVVLAIPSMRNPIMIHDVPYYGGVVVIMPEGDSATCLYLQEDGSLTENVTLSARSVNNDARIASIAVYLSLCGKPGVAEALDAKVQSPPAEIRTYTSILSELCFLLYIEPLSLHSERGMMAKILASTSSMHKTYLSDGFDAAWRSALRSGVSVRALFRDQSFRSPSSPSVPQR
jgi:hypothetical protein